VCGPACESPHRGGPELAGFSKDGNEWGNLHARPPSSLVFRGLMLDQ
jgi:hypothetical protein